MLGTLPQVTNQDLITYFTCELPAMNHLIVPGRETLVLSQGWVSPGPRAMYTSWLSPEASGARGITSDSGYLCVLVLGWKLQGTDRAKRQTKALVPSCLVWSRGRLATLLSGQNIFPLFLLWRWLVKNISTWPWSLVAGTQLTTSWDPEMSSLVLCVCPFSPSRSIKQSPQRTWLVPPSHSLVIQSSKIFLSIKEGTSPLIIGLSQTKPCSARVHSVFWM